MAKQPATPKTAAAATDRTTAAQDAQASSPPSETTGARDEGVLDAMRLLLQPDAYAVLVDTIADEDLRLVFRIWGRLRGLYPTAAPAPSRPRAYDVQPVGIPQSAMATLDSEDVHDCLHVLLEAVQVWESEGGDMLDDDQAYRRLLRLTRALEIMITASLTVMAPLVQAHDEDARAAQEWQRDRWFARSRMVADRPGGPADPAAPAVTDGAGAAANDTADVQQPLQPATAGDVEA